MSLGFDAISALPFAASGNEGNVTINVSANALTISVGQPTATVTFPSFVEVANGNADIASNPKLINFLKRGLRGMWW